MKNLLAILSVVLLAGAGRAASAEKPVAAPAATNPPAALLPEGNYPRESGVWTIINGTNLVLKIQRTGQATLILPGAVFYLPVLHMRFDPASGQITPLFKKYESIKGEVKDIDGGQEALVTAQADNGLDVTLTYKVVGNTCAIRQVAKSSGLIVRGVQPLYLGGLTSSVLPPVTLHSRREEEQTNKHCEDLASLSFEHGGKRVGISFGHEACTAVSPNSKNPNYYQFTATPTNMRERRGAFAPGDAIVYSVQITVTGKEEENNNLP